MHTPLIVLTYILVCEAFGLLVSYEQATAFRHKSLNKFIYAQGLYAWPINFAGMLRWQDKRGRSLMVVWLSIGLAFAVLMSLPWWFCFFQLATLAPWIIIAMGIDLCW